MKKILSTLILLAILLAGCTNPTAAPSDMPTPAQAETPAQPAPTEAPTPEPSAEPTAAPTTVQPEPAATQWVAFIGRDGNLKLVDAVSGTAQFITTDAVPFSSNSDVISYQRPLWSSDGRYLLFEREFGKAMESGYSFSYSLMIYDSTTGQVTSVLEDVIFAGYTWKPNTHQITYARSADPNYFTARGEVDAALATGLFWLDVDSGGTGELVKPEAGYTLVDPRWAPNGQLVSFSELIYMEGRGPLATYDFTAGQYVRRGEAIGFVDWSLDGSQMVFDYQNYAPSYTERIFLANRDGSGQRQLSADLENGYASSPLFSPAGDKVAYIETQGMEPQLTISLMVLDSLDSQPRNLAQLTQAYNLAWTPDGTGLLVATGNYPETQVALYSVADGSFRILADGWQAVMQP
jgi:Tol biopolymer transport system component